MTIPALIFGCMIATLMGALFHLWRGGKIGSLILFLILSWIGFWGGQLLFDFIGWRFFSYGSIHLGLNLITCIIVLGIGFWLIKNNQISEKPAPKKFRNK